jgi:hypothetical protein
MVLTAAGMLTVFSIIGSVAAANLIPLRDSGNASGNKHERQENAVSNKMKNNDTSAKKESLKKAEFTHDQFNSVVKPKLSSCFNCGVITAIETKDNNLLALDLNDGKEGLLSQYIENYLDAHRENARIIVLGKELADGYSTSGMDEKFTAKSTTYLIKVRMQDGSQHTITQDTQPEHNVGDTIRLINERTVTA